MLDFEVELVMESAREVEISRMLEAKGESLARSGNRLDGAKIAMHSSHAILLRFAGQKSLLKINHISNMRSI